MDSRKSFTQALASSDKRSAAYIFGIFVALLIAHRIIVTIYRIYFHPLSAFPGPASLAATGIISSWKSNIAGTFPFELLHLHSKYGPIVRTGPNSLALDGSIGWNRVYGHRVGAKADEADEFSKTRGFLFPQDHISILASPRDVHRRQRRQLAHAFSESALRDQEALVMQYVDLLVSKLDEHAAADKAVNIVNWLNFTTFDIIGDLAFSDSFGSLEKSDYHPWVWAQVAQIRAHAFSRFINAYPLLKPLVLAVCGSDELKHSGESDLYAQAKAKERMSMGVDGTKGGKKDLVSYMMRHGGGGGGGGENGEPITTTQGFSELEIMVNSPILTGAGSETTATALSGLFFHVGQDRGVYDILAREIREAFPSAGDISMKSAAKLQYLQAVLEETLRCYPPAVETPPRVCPGAEIEGRWVPSGTSLSVHQFSTFNNPANFRSPHLFLPQRWLPSSHPLHDPSFASDNKSVMKPFSHGPRDCIGKNLAYAEMRLVVAKILHMLDFELCPGMDGWKRGQRVYLVWQKPPLMVRFSRRKGMVGV